MQLTDSKYQSMHLPIDLTSGGGFRAQVVSVIVCGQCGALVGDRTAHDRVCTTPAEHIDV